MLSLVVRRQNRLRRRGRGRTQLLLQVLLPCYCYIRRNTKEGEGEKKKTRKRRDNNNMLHHTASFRLPMSREKHSPITYRQQSQESEGGIYSKV